MAQLKNTVISGSLRATDTVAAQTAQFKILKIPDGTNSTNYTTGTNGYIIKTNGTNVYWAADNAGVTSVQVQASAPLQSSISSAQNSSLNTTISFQNQNANKILAGPSSGNAAAPSFRALVAADLPTSGATSGNYGPSDAANGTNGTTLNVPYITVDTYGRITAISNKTYTSVNTWRPIGTGATDAAAGNHNHDSTYLKLSGGTLTGNLTISHTASATMTADSTNPKITFAENGAQPVHLIYSDWDNYRAPAGLKIIGGTSATPAWFEVEGQVYAAGFNGPLSGTATKAIQDGDNNTITSTYIKLNTPGGIAYCFGNGQNWYFKIATINITSGYINRPIIFEISGRGIGLTWLQVLFKNTNSTDPGLYTFYTNNCNTFYIKKTATSTWEIYGKYSEQWGHACLHRITGTGADIGVTINMTNIGTTEPSDTTQATYGWYAGSSASCTGNAATATTWETARTLTIGATGKSVNGSEDVSWSMNEIMGSSDSTKFYRGDKTWTNTLTDRIHLNGTRKLQWTVSDNDNNPDGASWYGLGAFEVSEDNATRPWICLSHYWGLSFRARDNSHVKINGNIVLNAGNYNDYAPKKDGTGASGSWGINITGSSASCTGNAATSTKVAITTSAPTASKTIGYLTISPAVTGNNALEAENSVYVYNTVSNNKITATYVNVGQGGVSSGGITLHSPQQKNFHGDIVTTTLTANRTYTLPDNTGTIALTSSNITGNAATATAFSANKTVALTGDVTGSASSTGGWSITTTLANSGATEGSYGDSAAQTPGYGATFKVPYITVDAKGRVTAISEHTVTIPASDNTNTLNTAGSTNSTSKLFLIGATSQAANPTTNSYQYTYTNNGLLSALKVGLNLNGTEKAHMEWNNDDQTIDFVFA